MTLTLPSTSVHDRCQLCVLVFIDDNCVCPHTREAHSVAVITDATELSFERVHTLINQTHIAFSSSHGLYDM